MLALFGAPPPQATQTLPRLSLCLHACANTACELRTSTSLCPPPLQVRVRGARRPTSAAAETAVAATTTTPDVGAPLAPRNPCANRGGGALFKKTILRAYEPPAHHPLHHPCQAFHAGSDGAAENS